MNVNSHRLLCIHARGCDVDTLGLLLAVLVTGAQNGNSPRRQCPYVRGCDVDTLGLLLAVLVPGAHADDGATAPQVLDWADYRLLAKVLADSNYHNKAL